MGRANVPKYHYALIHLQTDLKMRSAPEKFEYGTIHLHSAGIGNDIYAVTAANSETGEVLPMTEEDRGIYIMGVIY